MVFLAPNYAATNFKQTGELRLCNVLAHAHVQTSGSRFIARETEFVLLKALQLKVLGQASQPQLSLPERLSALEPPVQVASM